MIQSIGVRKRKTAFIICAVNMYGCANIGSVNVQILLLNNMYGCAKATGSGELTSGLGGVVVEVEWWRGGTRLPPSTLPPSPHYPPPPIQRLIPHINKLTSLEATYMQACSKLRTAIPPTD